MKIHGFFFILYAVAAVLAQNARRVLPQDNVDVVQFNDEKIIDILPTLIAKKKALIAKESSKRKNVPSLRIFKDDESAIKYSLSPLNLTVLEINRIRSINGEACLANAIKESTDLLPKLAFQTKMLPTDILNSLNNSCAKKFEGMIKHYGGACTLAIMRLYESRLPIAAYRVKLRSSGNSTLLEEIFGIQEGWSEIGEKIKLEYGDHCLLGLFHMIRLLSNKLSDRTRSESDTRHIDKNNLRKLEIIHGTECISAATKFLRISPFADYANEDGKSHVIRGRKGDPDAITNATKNGTFVIPEEFHTRYGKSCVLLVRKLEKLSESRSKLLRKKSNDRRSEKNLAKMRYIVQNDFEEMSSTYGRTCLMAASGLLDIKVKEGGRIERKTRHYAVPSTMRNDLAWPFYATRGQSKKLADEYGTKCAGALYELAKRRPTDKSQSKVSITRRAYLRLDSPDYRKLKEKYGSDCSRALVRLLDIDVDSIDLLSSTNETTSINFERKGDSEGLPINENEIVGLKIEVRSPRSKRAARFRFEKRELEKITLQFRKLGATKQEQVCLYLRRRPRLKNPLRLVRKLLGNTKMNKGEKSGVHFDQKRGHELSLKNRRDREILILRWACEDRRPDQDKIYKYAVKSLIENTEDGQRKDNPKDTDEVSQVNFRMDDSLGFDELS